MMKYRIIEDSDEVTVITEDGGVACIRAVDELDNGDGRRSVTDYYQTHFTQEMLLANKSVWDELGEGKMYCEDWANEFNDFQLVKDALEWLCFDCEYELDETIWKDF